MNNMSPRYIVDYMRHKFCLFFILIIFVNKNRIIEKDKFSPNQYHIIWYENKNCKQTYIDKPIKDCWELVHNGIMLYYLSFWRV